jgi:signal transduction histidine kinase
MIRSEGRPRRGPQLSATPDNTLADPEQLIADLRRQLAECKTERDEALQRETATAEVLGVINSSPGDLAPVFEAMLEKATRLCDAPCAILWILENDGFKAAATLGVPDAFAEFLAQPLAASPSVSLGAIRRGEAFVQNEDLAAPETYPSEVNPLSQAVVELGGARTGLLVPLQRDGALLGAIRLYRKEVRLFSCKQIALLQNFAAQAVIAMENARLITETREALEQQTATAEVLQVINSSQGDLAPVFDAMLEKAHSLCGIAFGSLQLHEDGKFRAIAVRGVPGPLADMLRLPHEPRPGAPPFRLLAGERIVHIADMADPSQQVFPRSRAAVEHGFRTALYVPLRRRADLFGFITAYRDEVRPFSEKEIALLENFAAQAVIATENARLLTETREVLEQQTATAEVLQVINSSPGDLAPVFDAMLERAMRLCEAQFGFLTRFDGEAFHAAAMRGVPAAFAESWQREPRRPGPGISLYRLMQGESLVHIPDITAEDSYRAGDPIRRALADMGGARTGLWVALRKDGALLGAFVIYRKEVRPFSDKQIALLQNFAAQAVIAMENARLLTETREALEQQTATAEILEVINRSPGDLAPVFDAILEKAHGLCGATRGTLFLFDGMTFRGAAVHGYPEELAERLRQGVSVSLAAGFAPLLAGDRLVHFPDLMQVNDPMARLIAERGGVRTNLLLPLRKDGALLGVISCNRQEVQPYGDREIVLLESFAAQAVIAMDNARLLNEIRHRQAELRVTFDNMGDGVAMFDGELRLAAWNLNFQRILDLPDTLLAEHPSYPDYIRFLAERGEFGTEGIAPERSRRLEAIDQELRLDHMRPDGRVIEVRRNAVPGGGFVVIYGDVTERKRAEAEIRAARDIAERALQELKTTQASLLHAQKMGALGQLTAGIAHEIKNPLNFVNNFAELSGELLQELRETAAPAVAALADDQRAAVDEVVEMLRGNLAKIAEHGKRADGIVKSMLEHSRGVSGERRAVDLNGLVEEALNLAYHGARAQDASFNITLEREFDRGLTPMELAPQEMTRVFLNLFGNGFYATTKRQREGAGPEFRPTLKVTTRDLGDAVEVRVRDNGTGIAPEIRDRLFQPFVTTKPTGEGTGLGLSISWDIVTQEHGGTIEVDSAPGEFTEFTICLPRRTVGGAV